MTTMLDSTNRTRVTAPVSADGDSPPRLSGALGYASIPLIDVQNLTREFGSSRVLDDVSLRVRSAEIHALLGPNGAGKTTLLRILAGLTAPTSGSVHLLGSRAGLDRLQRQRVGFIPAGDRSFYLRLSGLENLIFFGRLQGLSHVHAASRASQGLAQVGLAHAARVPVRLYSHGMYKRLAVARALLTSPSVFLVDEATHDLDPHAAEAIRSLVRARADAGAAIIWTTQRVDEIRGFADTVTLLHKGTVRFSGSVARLSTHSLALRYLLRLRPAPARPQSVESLAAAVAGLAELMPAGGEDPELYRMVLRDGTVFGEALAALTAAGVGVLAAHQERADIEQAFMDMTRDGASP